MSPTSLSVLETETRHPRLGTPHPAPRTPHPAPRVERSAHAIRVAIEPVRPAVHAVRPTSIVVRGRPLYADHHAFFDRERPWPCCSICFSTRTGPCSLRR
ncbi:hypothetical protein D7S86_00090 [Pararobbsia silviterrae]|uniref:Uncharacterized protein n=1 Tax=Pararobbsia silviterrae TaxID=1792498 RepID=A0A494YCH0_9BURK|nr:hypothetical protein D7S86_00090 [Pararobbsia silviterrae]